MPYVMSSPEEEMDMYWTAGETYTDFIADEGVPLYDDYYIEDVAEIELDDWERTGGRGAIVHLVGNEMLNDVHVHEIPVADSLEPITPLYEQIVYVVSGNGATVLENPETGEQLTFEWNTGSLFFLPANLTHRHINQSDEPARLACETDLPVLFRLFRSEDYIFDGGPSFTSVLDEDYSEEGELSVITGVPAIWDANFIPDLSTFDNLVDYSLRGAGGTNVKFRFPGARTLRAHMSEFPVGRYKKAHKHGPGAAIIVIEGDGFSLMWPPDRFDERVKVDWKKGSIAVPPADWYHQHFNMGDEPARYLALHRPNVLPLGPEPVFDSKDPKNFKEYSEEDPQIRELFESELAERGIESQMPPECYEDPDYEFEVM